MLNFDEILNQKQASNPQPWQPQSSSWSGEREANCLFCSPSTSTNMIESSCITTTSVQKYKTPLKHNMMHLFEHFITIFFFAKT